MSTPLGFTAGHSIKVEESVEVLAGGGPADVVELTLALARGRCAGAGVTGVDPADKLRDGSAMDVWRRMIRAQGGDPDAALPVARESHVVPRPRIGGPHPPGRDGRGVWPRGVSGPVARARRTRSRPPPACAGHARARVTR